MKKLVTPLKVFSAMLIIYGSIYYIFHHPDGTIYMAIGVMAVIASLAE